MLKPPRIRAITRGWLACGLLVGLLFPAGPVSAGPPKPPKNTGEAQAPETPQTQGAPAAPGTPGAAAQSLSDKFVQAHRDVESAVVEVRFSPYFTYPDETQTLTVEYRVVLDRKAGRVRIDRPGYTLICDGKDILLVSDAIKGKHLRVPLEGALSYEKLATVFPDLANPLPPALILLLSDDPMSWLSAGQAQKATPLAPLDTPAGQRALLKLPAQYGDAEFTSLPGSLLLDEMLMKVDPTNLAGSGMEAARFHYNVAWSSLNQPVDDALFVLDLKASRQTTTLQDFLAVGGGAGGQGQGPGGGAVEQPKSLVGQPLPDLDIEQLGSDQKVNLSKLDQKVVVLEFFASWTRPSTLDVPALSDYLAWCQKEGHDVAVYAIAVGESSESMSSWKDKLEKLTGRAIDVPILLDTSTDVAQKLGLPTLPRTMIVIDGKVVDVKGGTKTGFLEELKKATPDWLEGKLPAAEEKEKQAK